MILPLHILKIKYRDMIDDLIDKDPEDRLIAITCMKVKNDGRYGYEKICTIGQLISVNWMMLIKYLDTRKFTAGNY